MENNPEKMKSSSNSEKGNNVLVPHKGFVLGETFKGNLDIGEIILGAASRGNAGLEIMNASTFFQDFGIKANDFAVLGNTNFSSQQNNQSMMISILLKAKEARTLPLTKVAVPWSSLK